MGGGEPAVTISVVLASCRPAAIVRDAVQRLGPQCRASGAELIVARSTPYGASDPDRLFEGCRVVDLPSGSTIPQLRGAGLAVATGDLVLLTEDNCVPRSDWVSRLASGFGAGADVVGGTMGNAHPNRPVDAGAYYAEYGFFGPARSVPGEGASPFVTGANVGYRRSVVGDAAGWALAGDWEGVIHHRLAARGARFALVSDAIVEQNLHYRVGSFCRDRFAHGRDYAAKRQDGWSRGRRLAMAAVTPLLPPLLTWRAWRHAGRLDSGGFLKALPYTLLFFTAWAAGEGSGYLREATR
jgi:hypothetical protein